MLKSIMPSVAIWPIMSSITLSFVQIVPKMILFRYCKHFDLLVLGFRIFVPIERSLVEVSTFVRDPEKSENKLESRSEEKKLVFFFFPHFFFSHTRVGVSISNFGFSCFLYNPFTPLTISKPNDFKAVNNFLK
jgi:hypothetical protein